MKYFLTFLLLLGAAFAQNSTVRSVSTLPATCNPGGGAGGAPADHVDLWTGTANIAYYCSAPNVWTPIFSMTGAGLGSSTNTVSLLPVLPNGESAVTQSCGDASTAVSTDAYVQCAIASISPSPAYSGNQLISGGGVELVAGTLNVTVGSAVYTIAGTQYASPLTTVTPQTADPTNPRIDVIGVNTSGAVFVLTGTPAVTPVEPTVNPASQLALTAVLVPANATSPSLSVTDIYHDCLEWTLSSSGAPINTCSTNNPYNGANPKTIEATAAAVGNYAQLTDPASGTVVLSNYNSFVFCISSKAAWSSTNSITIQWYNGTSPMGAAILLLPTGTFGFNSSTVGYQQVSIPTSLFQASGIPVTSVRFTVSGSGATFGFYLADITLQGGQNGQPSGVFMNWRGSWNTTAGYNINDVVNYLGVSWVALAANLNSAPSSTNGNWQQMTNPGVNQQVIYNCNGALCGDAGMVYNQPTAALTITGNMSANAYISTGAGTYTLKGAAGSCATGASSQDWLCFGTSHLQFSINAGSLFNIPGVASAGTSGHVAVFAANGIDLQDGGAPGGGSVTSFSAGNLSPLFTTSVATATSTPALTFSLSNAAANTIFGNFTGSSAGPSFNTINSGSNCGDSSHALSWTNGTGFGCQSVTGTSPVRGLSFTIYNPSGLTSGTAIANYVLLTVPYACTIQAYNLTVDTGTITVKFWKVATGTAIPTSGNSINTSGVSISSGTAIHSTTLTDFTTTSVSANDIMAMDITAVSSASMVNGVLACQ